MVRDEKGPLIVTHNYIPVVDNNNDTFIRDEEYPLDLSVKPSKEPISIVDDEEVVITKTVPGVLQIKYPFLKMTNTGALVLWNFLWALLQDSNYIHIAV